MTTVRRLRAAASAPCLALLIAAAAACAGSTRTTGGTASQGPRTDPVAIDRASARLAAGDSGPFSELEVEERARPIGGANPTYPRDLREAGVEGEVILRFVVGPDGRIVPGSVRVLRSSNPLFLQAVHEILPHARFAPARLAGRPVAQVVRFPFSFTIQP